MVPPVRPRPREKAWETQEEELPALARLAEALRAVPSLYRAIASLAVAAVTILLALHFARGFLSRDWAEKDRLAKARAAESAPAAPTAVTANAQDAWHLSSKGAGRFWTNLVDAGNGENAFGILACAARDISTGRTAARLALATGEQDPGRVYADLAVLALSLGEFPSAMRFCRIAAAFPPVPAGVRYNQALTLHRIGRGGEAATLLVRLLLENPEESDTRRLLARILLEKHRSDLAFSLLSEVAAQSTEDAPFALEAACLAAEEDNREEALRLFRIAAEKCGLHETTRTWQRPEFANLRQSEEGETVSSTLASRARETLRATLPLPDYTPGPRKRRY